MKHLLVQMRKNSLNEQKNSSNEKKIVQMSQKNFNNFQQN